MTTTIRLTDHVDAVGLPDIRPLNDAPWSTDALRIEHMARLTEALKPQASWDAEQRRAYTERVVVWTVRNLIADLPGLPGAVRERCRRAGTLGEAEAAARTAEAAAEVWTVAWGWDVAEASRAAAAAAWTAWAAAEAMAEVAEAEVAASWAAWWAAEAMAEVAEAVVGAAWAAEDPDATLIRAVNGWITCVGGHALNEGTTARGGREDTSERNDGNDNGPGETDRTALSSPPGWCGR